MSNNLIARINEVKKDTVTDSYSMSIGEIISLYENNEININPKFQREFRWTDYQKTSFIESIMINIPLQSIFVSQDPNGIWDLVDGLQRISTILEFVGKLKDEYDELKPPFILSKTNLIPEFNGIFYDSNDKSKCFPKELQLDFKRSRINVNIVKKESDINAKYELFQRLNTGGSVLSNQEVRNCVMIMTNDKFYDFVKELSDNELFVDMTPMSDNKEDESYRMELVTKYLVGVHSDIKNIEKEDLTPLLNSETLNLCRNKKINYVQEKDLFIKILKWLNNVDIDNDSLFKRYDKKYGKLSGVLTVATFHIIMNGIAKNHTEISNLEKPIEWLKQKIDDLQKKDEYNAFFLKGVRANDRFINSIIYGEEYFTP